MNGILNAISSRIWPTARPAPVAAPPKPQPEVLYTVNENGFRSFQMEKLSIAQCDVVTEDCRKEATYERYSVVGLAVAGTAVTIGVLIAGIVVAKLASLFFITTIANIATHFLTTFSPLTFFCVRVVTHVAALTGTAISLKLFWNYAYGSISNHWEKAKHLDDQALQAQLRKAVENLAAIPKIT